MKNQVKLQVRMVVMLAMLALSLNVYTQSLKPKYWNFKDMETAFNKDTSNVQYIYSSGINPNGKKESYLVWKGGEREDRLDHRRIIYPNVYNETFTVTETLENVDITEWNHGNWYYFSEETGKLKEFTIGKFGGYGNGNEYEESFFYDHTMKLKYLAISQNYHDERGHQYKQTIDVIYYANSKATQVVCYENPEDIIWFEYDDKEESYKIVTFYKENQNSTLKKFLSYTQYLQQTRGSFFEKRTHK